MPSPNRATQPEEMERLLVMPLPPHEVGTERGPARRMDLFPESP